VKPKVLIIGCGSIGERHLRCFQKTGRAEPVACEPRAEILQRIQHTYQVAGFATLEQAWAGGRYAAVVICAPAQLHVALALDCLQRGLHVLIEKPLSISLDGVDALRQAAAASGKFVRVGYTWHFHPGVKALRECLRRGEFGRPLQVVVASGQHFPTFRPAYREIYYTRHESGGGAIQDSMTHNVNTVEWWVGPTTRVFCDAAHQALEGVTVEDTVCAVARNGNVLVSYAHNQFQPPNETTFLVHCEGGSLKFESHEQRWAKWPRGREGWEYFPAPLKERDDMFVAQANDFLDGMLNGGPGDLCTVEEAIQTLKFNLAALESWKTGKAIEIS
jgi:predicted dehydrogenase